MLAQKVKCRLCYLKFYGTASGLSRRRCQYPIKNNFQGVAMTSPILEHIFNGTSIEQRSLDGYVNLTAMCQATGKQIHHYFDNKSTNDFLNALEASTGIPRSALVLTFKGGNNPQGTWGHPQVALHLGQWSSPKFAVWVSKLIFDWMSRGSYQPEPPPQHTSVYIKRILEQDHKVPRGFWSVFNASEKVLLHIETKLKLPVANYDLCDGSVGIRWSKFRVGKNWVQPSTTYVHLFKDQRGARSCHAYRNAELEYFQEWIDTKYIPDHLPAYLQTKYSNLTF